MADRPVAALTWDERAAMIEGALRDLPITPSDDPNAIPHDFLLPEIARELLLIGNLETPPASQAIVSEARTREEIAAVQKHATALVTALEALHRPAIEALDLAAPWQGGSGGLVMRARNFKAAVDEAKVPPSDAPTARGRPRNLLAEKATTIAADHFEKLTGRKAAPVNRLDDTLGPFVKLLDAVFEANGIEASAEHYARRVEEIRSKKT